MIARSLTRSSAKQRLAVVIFLFGILVFSGFLPATAHTERNNRSFSETVSSVDPNNRQTVEQTTYSANSGRNLPFLEQDRRYDLLRKELKNKGLELNSKVVSPFLLNLQGKDFQANPDGTLDLIISTTGEKPMTDMHSLANMFGFEMLRTIPQLDAYVFRGRIADFNAFLLKNSRSLDVKYVAPRTTYQIEGFQSSNSIQLDGTPNDPRWNDQYGPQIIRADKAWSQISSPPTDPVIIGVIDTGIDYNHPDLDGVYLPGGYDWVNDDTDPMDDNNHGTHVAGIIAAEINNSLGIAGVAGFGSSYVKVMAEKVFTSYGGGSDDVIAQGIVHAVDFGIDIMSNSWGGGPSDLIEEAMEYARDNGVIIIAAAGNGFGPDADLHYPASLPYVISVSSTDRNDQLSFFSSYGYTVDVAAPGSDILSSIIGGDYAEFSGTSMATPHVSATAALMLLKQPDLSPFEVRTLLHDTSVDLGTQGFDIKFGYGRIDAFNATVAAERPDIDLRATIYVPQHPIVTNSIIDITIGLFNFGTTNQDLDYTIKRDGKVIDSGTYTNFSAASEIMLQEQLFVVDPKDVTLEVFITPVTGETNLENNNATQVLKFGQQTYQMIAEEFSWDDARNGGYDAGLQGDDTAVEVPLPFSFEFYEGFNFETVFVSSNGYVSFIDPFPSYYYPSMFPDDFNPFVIAPLWTDLVMMDFFGNTTADSPKLWIKERNDSVIFQWTNAHLFFNPSANLTFQMVLYTNGDIRFNYLNAATDFATIGVNKGLRSNDYTQYWSPQQGPVVLENMSLLFTRQNVKVQNDVGVMMLTMPETGLPNDNYTIEFAVVNFGLNDATGVSYDLKINGTSVLSNTTDVESGFGQVFIYHWTPTTEGLYQFNLSVSPYLNETNLGNNVFEAEISIVSSNLNIPFDATMEYLFDSTFFGGSQNEWPLLTMYIEPSGSDPVIARFWLSYTDMRTGDLMFEFFFEFNILTFEIVDSFGERIPFVLPAFADIGYENSFGTIVATTTFNYQGQTLNAFRLENGYGQQVFYDQVTGAMLLDIEQVWNGTEQVTAEVELFYAPEVISPPSVNQLVKIFAPDGPSGGETTAFMYVRNTGATAVSGTTLSVTLDGSVFETTQMGALAPGESQVIQSTVPAQEGVHTISANISVATGETDVEDNFDTTTFRGIGMIAVFQDDYPFFSFMMEDVITYELGKGVMYFTSSDIGNVNISGYDRVVIASAQSASFRLAVSNNVEWFEAYAEQGGILEIHAGSENGRYLQLPGGIDVIGDVFYNEITIEDPNSDVFKTPYLVTSQMLSNWYWSALGHLTNLNPLTKVYATEGESGESNPVLAAQAQGSGYIIYTTLGVEAWWASYEFLSNLLQFVPTDVPVSGVTPEIQGNEEVVMYNDQYETLMYILESPFHDTYKVTVDGVDTIYDWDEPIAIVTVETQGWTVGTHTVRIEATDTIGQTTVMETTVEVLQAPTTTVESSSSTSDNGPLDLWIFIAGLGMLVAIPILKKKNRKI
ncbi:MAG: hypothetical protein D6732_22275 [Methanobacteriota archaeon]|nr:MAG: hypothetical protein D6732_22275 [Euryarchaeota archaeon]